MARRRLSRRGSARKTSLCRLPSLPKKRWPTSFWKTNSQLSALSKTRGGRTPLSAPDEKSVSMVGGWPTGTELCLPGQGGRLSLLGSRSGSNLLIQHRLSAFSQQERGFGVYIGGSDEAGSPVWTKMACLQGKAMKMKLSVRGLVL